MFQSQENHAKLAEFIEEIAAVCKRHGLSIGHEDSEGSFIIRPYSDDDIDWLRDALVDSKPAPTA